MIIFPTRLARVRLTSLFVAVAALLIAPVSRATSVIPPTFTELVAEADTVLRGSVISVHSEEFDSADGKGVRTLVTFSVERALKGSPGETVTLSFLGGTVGKRNLKVVGMPRFEIGQRQIVFFANNGRVICPLIGMGYGRYHVVTEAATQREYVMRENNVPLTSVDQIPLSLEGTAIVARVTSTADALSLSAFESQITDALGRGDSSQQKP